MTDNHSNTSDDQTCAGSAREVHQKLILRWIFYLAGLVILALGIMLNTKSSLGVSPIISVPYSISNIIGYNFANMTMLVYILFTLIEMMLHIIWKCTGRETSHLGTLLLKDALQIPVSILFTRFLNLFSAMVPSVHDQIVGQLAVLLVAILCTGVGAAMSLNMRIIPNPGDGIVQAISDTVNLYCKKKKGVGFCKNCFDIFNVCLTFTIGMAAGHPLLGLGIGTVLAMFGVGRVIAVFNGLFREKMEKAAF